MAMNPDFTKLNLEEHPHCSYDEWKAELEKTTGKNYDALYENTMERIPVGPLYGKDVYDQCNHLDYIDRKSTRLNSSHQPQSRMPSSA